MDQDEQAWYCSCGFLNEGLDSVCRSCGLSLEEARSEVWRRAQATAREGAAPYAAAPPPDLSAAQVPALGTPGGVIFPFLAGEPSWRRKLAAAGGLGAWFTEPAPRFAAWLAMLLAWVSRIALWLSAAAVLLLGVFQLVAGTSAAAEPDLKNPDTWISVIAPQEAKFGANGNPALEYSLTNQTDYPVVSAELTVRLLDRDGNEIWSGSAKLDGLAPHDTAQLTVANIPLDTYFRHDKIDTALKVTVDPDVAATAANAAAVQPAAPEAPAGPQPPEGGQPQAPDEAQPAPPRGGVNEPGSPESLPPPRSSVQQEELQERQPGLWDRLGTLLGMNVYEGPPQGGTGAVIGRGILLLLGSILYALLLLIFAEAQFHGLFSLAGMLIAACDARDTLIARRGLEIIESLEREARLDWRLASSQVAENVFVLLRLVAATLFLLGWAAALTVALVTDQGPAAVVSAAVIPPVAWFLADLGMKIALSWPFASRSMAALSRLAERAG